MKNKLLLTLCFAAVFFFGIMTGVATTLRWGREPLDKRAWQLHSRKEFQKLADDLNLTPQQREAIRPLMINAVQNQRRNLIEIRREFRKMEEAILKELDEPQRARYKELRKRFENRTRLDKEGREGRGRPHDEDGAPPPPPPGETTKP